MTQKHDSQVADLLARAREIEDQEAPHPAAGARMLAGIQARLENESKRRFRGPALAVAGAMAVAALVVLLRPGQKEIVVLEGKLQLVEQHTDLGSGSGFGFGEAIATNASDTVLIAVDPVAEMRMEPASELSVTSFRQVELARGTTRFDVRTIGKGLEVLAGDVKIKVIGTIFEVTRRTDEVAVSVSEGRVEISDPSGRRVLTAGERWSSKKASREGEASPFARALQMIRDGDYSGAADVYRALAKRQDHTAEIALYLLARLELQRFHRPKRALATLDRMTKRFPRGTLEIEAQLSRIEILESLGRCDAVRDAIRRLRRRPNGKKILDRIGSARDCR